MFCGDLDEPDLLVLKGAFGVFTTFAALCSSIACWSSFDLANATAMSVIAITVGILEDVNHENTHGFYSGAGEDSCVEPQNCAR